MFPRSQIVIGRWLIAAASAKSRFGVDARAIAFFARSAWADWLQMEQVSGLRKPVSPPQQRAFSLIELLAVAAIVAVMAVLSVPAIASLGRASGMNRAVAGLSLTFEQARTHAMANATYVRVGLALDSTGEILTCAVVAGSSGMTSDFSNLATYRPVSRLQKFDHVRLLDSLSSLPGMVASAPDIKTANGLNFQTTMGESNQTYTSVVQFSPSGEATLGGATQPRWVQLGIAPARGAANNYAVLQISGLTGQVRIFRP